MIKTADWIIDIGPEGGDTSGYIVAEGTPEQVAGVDTSFTGKFLKDVLSRRPSALVYNKHALSTSMWIKGDLHD